MEKKRVLLVKGGLDGHDRGIMVVAQALRDAGIEVIYGGLYQSPEEIVSTALEEDVDMVGISMLSGAHLGVFSEVLRLSKEETGEDWFVFGGGVIPKKDVSVLEKMGVKKIFLPGTNTRDITDFVLEVQTMQDSLTGLMKRTKKGEILAASRLMTLVQREDKKALRSVAKLSIPDALSIGVTGPGGVGKSSLINKLIYSFRKKDKTVGAITCDPASISGGAVLGDRIRMQEHITDKGVFVRSVAQYERYKGVTPATPYLMKIFGALKKEVIIIETVGVGQEDLGFREVVSTLILVLMPAMGDEIQMLKGGVIETADIIVVNKAELDGGDKMFNNLLNYFGDVKKENGWQTKICKTNSITGDGVSELVEGIQEHKDFLINKAA